MFFKETYLDLDLDGHSSTSRLHDSPKNLYWKHKVLITNESERRSTKIIEGAAEGFRLPSEIAMHLQIGDILTFIENEDVSRDLILGTFSDHGDEAIKEHIRWKKFLGDNGLGIYIYGREFLLGLDILRLHGFYFDEEGVRKDIKKMNRKSDLKMKTYF